MWRSLASNMLTILVVGMFMVAGVILWGQSRYSAEGPLTEAICLQVKRGSNMTQVSRDLEAQGAVTSGTVFVDETFTTDAWQASLKNSQNRASIPESGNFATLIFLGGVAVGGYVKSRC